MDVRSLAGVVGCVTVLAAAPAWADIKWTFDFSSNTNCLGADSSNSACDFGNKRNASSVTGTPLPLPPTTSITAQAWSNTEGPGTGDLQTAYLPAWGSNGLGVQNRDMANLPSSVPSPTPAYITAGLGDGGDGVEGSSPEHAMDDNQRADLILFSFLGDPMKLTGIRIGYKNNDSDIFVMAYTNGGTPTLSGHGLNDLTSSGWMLVGNYANIAEDAKVAVNAGGTTANHWLVGTGCFTGSSVSNCDGNKEYVKILALYTKPGDHRVPEPSSALLLALAAVGMWRFRTRG